MKLLGLAALVIVLWLLLTRKSRASQARPAPRPLSSFQTPMDGASGSDALDNITQAIYQFEGGQPGQRNVVNNNPGDLRSGPGMTGSAGGFATFNDIGDGWDALGSLVQKKAAAHPDWNFYDLFNNWLGGGPDSAPQGDPTAYANYVAGYAGFDPNQTVSSALGS